jgi:hypothetical protein
MHSLQNRLYRTIDRTHLWGERARQERALAPSSLPLYAPAGPIRCFLRQHHLGTSIMHSHIAASHLPRWGIKQRLLKLAHMHDQAAAHQPGHGMQRYPIATYYC